jgi:hypothetical protein
VSVLSLRPGGLRRQLRYAARRLRIVLVLGGVYVVGSTIARLVAPADSAFGEFAPPLLAIVLGVVFLFIAQDPKESA